MAGPEQQAGLDTAKIAAMNGGGAGGASAIGGLLAAAGVKSLSTQHNVSPKALGDYLAGAIPKIPVHMPISPLGLKGKPMKLGADFSGIGG